MRKVKIVQGEYYHIYNRENNQEDIFFENRDWARFLLLILHFQSSLPIHNITYHINHFIKHRVFNISDDAVRKILKNRYVELIIFTLMPNHFHLLVRGLKENGISQYMQRIQDAYTKYFNVKYGKSGHLFQGPYRAVHVKNNEQLLHLSAYIHRNQRELKKWKNKEDQYFWSSYQDCIKKNRWGELLKPQIITDQFSNPEEYKEFVDTSGTKLELNEKFLLE